MSIRKLTNQEAITLAILRLNADIQQTPHIFPLDAVQVEELREAIARLGDIQRRLRWKSRATLRHGIDCTYSRNGVPSSVCVGCRLLGVADWQV